VKVYIDNTCLATKAQYLVPEYAYGFNTLENFFNTKYTDGTNWYGMAETRSLIVWHQQYKESEMLDDLTILGFEIVIIDRVFTQLKHFTEFLDEQGLEYTKS
jgi:hypothetical protein